MNPAGRVARAIQQLAVGVGRDVDDGDVELCADPVGGFDAVHPLAELDIHQYQVRTEFSGFFYGFIAVGRDGHDVVAEATQPHAQGARNRALILDDEYIGPSHRNACASISITAASSRGDAP